MNSPLRHARELAGAALALVVIIAMLLLAGCNQADPPAAGSVAPTVHTTKWDSLFTITIVVNAIQPTNTCTRLEGGPIVWSALVDGQIVTWPLLYSDGPEFPLSKADVGKCMTFEGKSYSLVRFQVDHCTLPSSPNRFVFCFQHPPRDRTP